MLKKAMSLLLALLMTFSMGAPALAIELDTVESVVPTEEIVEETAEPLADTDAVKVEHNGETTYYENLQKAFDGFAPNIYEYDGTYVITLLGDTTGASKTLEFPTNGVIHVTLDLNGHTLSAYDATKAVLSVTLKEGTVDAPNTFTIKDSSGDNSGKITGGKGGVIFSGKNCTLNFEGGTITGNHGATKGGGINVGATAYLNMTGGVITGNSVTYSSTSTSATGLGGGVFANYANISGGVITGNAAYKGTSTNIQCGRGGGVCTDVSRTTGYSTLTIANGVVYGNTAENAGDDVMAQGNGSSTTKFSFSIGTENWYIDGWNGTKATAGNGEAARYDAENPVAYTDGGFTNAYNKTVGLKYVAPTVEEVAPEAPSNRNFDNNNCIFEFACNTKLDEPHQTTGVGVDTNYCEVAEPVKNEAGEWTSEVTYNVKAAWERWIIRIYVNAYPGYEHAPHAELPESITFTLKWDSEMEKWVYEGDPNIYDISCESAVSEFTVTYTDGVDGEEVFADQTYTVKEGDATPAFNGEPTRDGYEFKGWDPAVAETVTADATYTAQWEKLPSYVAQLESTGEKFETLQAALDAAYNALKGDLDADKITLLADTTECVKFTWARSKNITLTIDLNGHTVTGNGTSSVMTFSGSGSVSKYFHIVIDDSSESRTGAVTDGSATFGGAIKMDNTKNSDSLTINGGNFRDNTATSSGGAIYCSTTASITINGGTFTGNTAKTGGAISAYNVTVNGGVITGNTATDTATYSGRGGGIQVWGTTSYLIVTGGQIYGNTASRYGDDIVFASTSTAGTSQPSMSLISAADMNVEGVTGWYVDGYNGNYTSELKMTDRYSAENAVEFTDYADFSGAEAKGNAIALKAAKSTPEYTVTYTDGVEDEEIFADQTYTVKEGDATPAFNGEPTRDGYEFKGWDPAVAETVTADATYTAQWEKLPVYVAQLESTGEKFETLQAAIDAANGISDQTITLLTDIKESTSISWTAMSNSPDAYNLTIDLNGKTVTGNGGSVFTIGRYGSYTSKKLTVTFKDSVGGAVVTGGTGTVNSSSTYGGAIYAISGSFDIIIDGGEWTGNSATYGGVVAAAYTNNTNNIIINGGTFTGNTATSNGGAIYGRNVSITGGTITGNSAASGGGVYTFIAASTKLEITGGAVYGNTATTDGDDIIWRANKGTTSTAFLKLIPASSMGNGLTGWYKDDADNRFSDENHDEFKDYTKYTALNTRIALKAAQVIEKYTVTYTDGVEDEEVFADQTYTVKEGDATPAFNGEPTRDGYEFKGWDPAVAETVTADATYTAQWRVEAPVAPQQSNTTDKLVAVICDSDPTRHETVNYPWYPLGHCEVKGDVKWDEELKAYTVYVKIGGLYAIYIPSFEKTYNNTAHRLIEGAPNEIYTTLVWNGEKWDTQDGNPIEIHTECQTAPVAPVFDQVDGFQIKVHGTVNGKEVVWTSNLVEESVTIGEVKGSREEGFTVDVTVTIEEGDSYITAWTEKKAPGKEYDYDWSQTPETVTITLKYTGDLNGTLHGERNASNTNVDWVLDGTDKNYGVIADAYVIPEKPAAPTQNTVEGLVTVICTSDSERHSPVPGKWYPQNCETKSEITWNADDQVWTVDVRVDSIDWYYVHLALESAYNNIHHDLESDSYVDTTLVWNADKGVWAPTETIEVLATCKTVPDAPVYDNYIDGYQVKVHGDVNGEEKTWTTSIPEGGYTLSEVYGSREEGFYVDVTITLKEGDIYESTWIEKRNPGYYYNYDWNKTEKDVTFTLEYNGSLTGTLYGNSLDGKDWVLSTTGNNWGVVSEAYLKQVMATVVLQIYRNGDTTTPYKTVYLDPAPKGATLDLSQIGIADYYSSAYGFEMVAGWFNDGGWNSYKAGNNPAGLKEVYINGWTNLYCMVTDYQPVQLVIYRNGNTTTPYKTVSLAPVLKGDVLNLTTINVADYYSSANGFEVVAGMFNDGRWNQYKAGQNVEALSKITVNGWTNVICMVADYQMVVVHGVVNGDKGTDETIFTGRALYGENLIEWLDANVTIPEKTGYTADKWYNWDWYGHKIGNDATVNGWTNVYVTYTADKYEVTFNTNGGAALDPITVTYDAKYGKLPSSALTGFSGGDSNWYLVDENGNVTGTKITSLSIVKTARDHELFVVRKVLAPTLKITLEVPGAISDDYKYYVPGNSTRILTVTVNNMNKNELDYSYQWYKNGVAIEGATEAVLTLPGNVSDSGTYKVVVTATLKDGSKIIVTSDTASAEKEQKVQIMYAANTLRLNENYGENKTSDSYWGADTATIRSAATREGYTFAGWNTAADGSGETYNVGDTVTFPGANGNGGIVLELFAQWTANEYTVTLDPNGGKVDPATITVTYNEAIGELPVPTRTGYTFAGWTEEDGDPVNADTMYTVAGDSKYVAMWTANEYTITFDPNNGEVDPATKVVVYDSKVGELPVPTRTGYTFAGWTEEDGDPVNADTIYTVAGDSKYVAMWSKNTYTIKLNANGGKVYPATVSVNYDSEVGELPVPKLYGWDFAGWYDEAGNKVTAETIYTVAGDTTLTAYWERHTFTVTLNPNGGKVNPTFIGVEYEDTVGKLPVPTCDGCIFEGWFLNGKKVDSNYVVTGDVTFTARWSLKTTHEHDWTDWETLNGVKSHECKVCGLVEKIYVSATGKTDEESNPNTGATVTSGSAASAMAAIAVLSAAAYVCGKRK